MANEVKFLLYDIGARIGNPTLKDPQNPLAILRAMNHVYRTINSDNPFVEKVITIAAGAFSDVVTSYALPADFFQLFNIEFTGSSNDGPRWVDPKLWNVEQMSNNDVYTIINNTMYFANVADDTALTIRYYSYGYELVDAEDADLTTGLINTPEWNRTFWRLLVYLTCADLVPEYPLIKHDLLEANHLKDRLYALAKMKQSKDPIVQGGYAGPYNQSRDPDTADGLWITRFPG